MQSRYGRSGTCKNLHKKDQPGGHYLDDNEVNQLAPVAMETCVAGHTLDRALSRDPVKEVVTREGWETDRTEARGLGVIQLSWPL